MENKITSPSPPGQGQIQIIQIIRLFAALCVLIYHSSMVGQHGYFAVEIFNIISGFVIMYSTRKPDSSNCFFRKRLIRIIPLYWLSSLAMYVLITILPSLSVMSEATPEYLLKSLFFIPFSNSKGYNTPILGLGWTLNYEILFYVIFFLALHLSHNYRGLITSLVLIFFVLSGQLWNRNNNFYWEYYSNLYLLEFVFGIITFYIFTWIQKKKIVIHDMILKGIALCSLLWMLFNVGISQNIHRSFCLGIPAALFFLSCLLCFENTTFPSFTVKLGNASYSIYLIEYFTTALFKVIAAGWALPLQILGLVATILLTLALSLVSYELIEYRFTAFLKRCFCSSAK